MYTDVKGTFENGQVVLEEPAPTLERTRVLVMFLSDSTDDKKQGKKNLGLGLVALQTKDTAYPTILTSR